MSRMLSYNGTLNLKRLLSNRAVQHLTALAALTAVAWLLFFYQFDQRALWSSQEGRAGQHAQLMLDTGRWGMPTLYYGEADYQKPPLYYWMVALVAWLRGGTVDAWAIRLPAVLAAILGVWLVYGLGHILWRPGSGFIAALILATNLRYSWLARVGRIDMPLTLAIALVLASFWLAYRRVAGLAPFSQPAPAWRWMLPAYLAAALSILLKGPVGLVLPAASIGLFLVMERQPIWPWKPGFIGLAHRLGLWWGMPLVLAIAAPWFIWATVVTEGAFFKTFFLHHNLDRSLGVDGLKPEPCWYYIPQILIDTFPWSIWIPAAVVQAIRWRRAGGSTAARYVLAWTLAMFVFLSLVRFKRHDYLLPLLPGFALWMAGFWDRLCERPFADSGRATQSSDREAFGQSPSESASWRWVRWGNWIVTGSAALAAVLLLVMRNNSLSSSLLDCHFAQRLLHNTDRMILSRVQYGLNGSPTGASLACAAIGLAGAGGLLAVRRARAGMGVSLFATAWSAAFWLYVSCVLPPLEPLREQRTLAETARRWRQDADPLYYYGREDQQLMFYLGPRTRWLPNRSALRRLMDQEEPAFVVVELSRFEARQQEWPELAMVAVARNVDNPWRTHRDPAVLVTNEAGWRLVQCQESAKLGARSAELVAPAPRSEFRAASFD